MNTKLMTEEAVAESIWRLLNQPRDLSLSGAHRVENSLDPKQAPRHRDLFRKYTKELKKAIPEALEWWYGLIEAAKEEYRTEKRAKMETWKERPAGPVSDPTLVGIIRKYWLACDALNRESQDGPQVAPEAFLLQWLLDAGEEEPAEILSGMPYWPVGLDIKGNWV